MRRLCRQSAAGAAAAARRAIVHCIHGFAARRLRRRTLPRRPRPNRTPGRTPPPTIVAGSATPARISVERTGTGYFMLASPTLSPTFSLAYGSSGSRGPAASSSIRRALRFVRRLSIAPVRDVGLLGAALTRPRVVRLRQSGLSNPAAQGRSPAPLSSVQSRLGRPEQAPGLATIRRRGNQLRRALSNDGAGPCVDAEGGGAAHGRMRIMILVRLGCNLDASRGWSHMATAEYWAEAPGWARCKPETHPHKGRGSIFEPLFVSPDPLPY